MPRSPTGSCFISVGSQIQAFYMHLFSQQNRVLTLTLFCRQGTGSESRVANRIMVLQLGVRPEPLRWESRVQDTGPPETSWLHVISNGQSSPRDLRLNDKTQLHSTTSKLQCWTPYAKQLARQEHNPTH